MKREMLTPSRCREELWYVNRLTLMEFLPVMGLVLVLILMIGGLFYLSEFSWYEKSRWNSLFAWCLGAATLLSVGIIIGIPYFRKRKINRMVLEIVEDKLAYADRRIGYRSFHGWSRRPYDYYVLGFAYFGEYQIPERSHYEWSNRFSADRDKVVYERAEAGDTYYIVLDGKAKKKKPLLIYNTKEFVFCPYGTTRSPDDTWKDSVSGE